MAATLDDILTVDEMKAQLRLPASHVSENALIQGLIAQAVNRVSLDCGIPLLDVPRTVFAELPVDPDEPMNVYDLNFRFDKANTAHEIDYWTTSGRLGDAPDGSISRAEIGRTIRADNGSCYLIYLADGGKWPDDVLADTRARITGSTSYTVPDGLLSAVIVLVRWLYSGDVNYPNNPAYKHLIQPYRRLTPTGV